MKKANDGQGIDDVPIKDVSYAPLAGSDARPNVHGVEDNTIKYDLIFLSPQEVNRVLAHCLRRRAMAA